MISKLKRFFKNVQSKIFALEKGGRVISAIEDKICNFFSIAALMKNAI